MVERLVSVKVLASVGMVPSGHSSPQSARRRGWLVRSRSISRNANNGKLGLGRDLRQTEQQCPELPLFGLSAMTDLSPQWAPKRKLISRILLDNYYLPGDLERQIDAFVEHYNHVRYHESINNLTPADVYFGRAETILAERERIKRATIANRRLQHQLQAA